MSHPIWKPSNERIKQANITRYIDFINSKHNLKLTDYESLHLWSLQQTEDFWISIWQFASVIGEFHPNKMLTDKEKMPGASWFQTAHLNFAQNLLKCRDDSLAIIERGEHCQRKTLTFSQLYKQVCYLAASMKRTGIKKGDRVVGFLPNISETVIAMLATASLGAVWSSCSPDFGLDGVIDRFGQIQPKLLFATNGYYYNGKLISTVERVDSIINHLPDLKATVIISYLKEDVGAIHVCPLGYELLNESENITDYDHFIDSNANELDFTPVSFNDPLYIMYSSGTTGVPKCIVHSVGGTLLQHLKELILHTDLKSHDRIFFYTTCGWMMWNWLVSSLSVGSTIILYDGSPFYPTHSSLFDLADQEKVSILGSSAKFFSACEKAGLQPINTHNLSNLKTILSTGSPLSHESFDYIYQKVKSDGCLSSISGGTDIISCFALGCPILPVYRGELQCIGLGMNVAFYDDTGLEVISEKGELICKSPFPSMPTGFWDDPDGKKYHKAYFEKFKNVWAHGDYGEIVIHETTNQTPSQRGIIIYGRSDAVLNPGGVRIGTGEIYRQVEKVDLVADSVAIGQEWDNDIRIILFVKLKEGITLTQALIDKIKKTIREKTSPRHVPAKVIAVKDIPKTISGKIVELAVRNVVHNRPVQNKDALANPEALNYFTNLKELKS